MDIDLLNQVAKALGVELAETEPHKRLFDELAFAQGYGSAPGLSVEVTDAMRSALSEHEQKINALGCCV